VSSSVRFAALLALYAVVSAYGLFRLKAAPEVISGGFLLGAAFYVASFGIWLVILRSYPLSLAFPAAAGVAILATQFIGLYVLSEPFSVRAMTGTVLVALGVVLVYSSTP